MCVQSKSSADTMCSEHTDKDASPPAEKDLEVAGGKFGSQTMTLETKSLSGAASSPEEALKVACAYLSANRPCLEIASSGQLFCTQHTCKTDGCGLAKSSKDTMCSSHMVDEAAPPAEEYLEVTSGGDVRQAGFGETEPQTEMDAPSTKKEASDTSGMHEVVSPFAANEDKDSTAAPPIRNSDVSDSA